MWPTSPLLGPFAVASLVVSPARLKMQDRNQVCQNSRDRGGMINENECEPGDTGNPECQWAWRWDGCPRLRIRGRMSAQIQLCVARPEIVHQSGIGHVNSCAPRDSVCTYWPPRTIDSSQGIVLAQAFYSAAFPVNSPPPSTHGYVSVTHHYKCSKIPCYCDRVLFFFFFGYL